MHFTAATVAVGLVLAHEPDTEHWAYDIAKNTKVKYPTVMDIMHRMMDAGWLTDRLAPQYGQHGVAAHRRLYQVTDAGRAELERLRQAADKPAPTAGPPRGLRPHTKPRPTVAHQTGTCPECKKRIRLRTDGFLSGHGKSGRRCPGSWEEPVNHDGPHPATARPTTEAPATR